MPRVHCPQHTCVFWEEGYCSADEIELDSEQLSCLSMEELAEHLMVQDEVDWDEDIGEEEDEEDERDDEEEFWTRY